MTQRIDLLQRALDLLIPRRVAHHPQHGRATTKGEQQMSGEALRPQQGSRYPALHRLERRSLIKAHWGTSDNNRRTKYYELTRTGRRQLDADQKAWEKLTAPVAQVLRPV